MGFLKAPVAPVQRGLQSVAVSSRDAQGKAEPIPADTSSKGPDPLSDSWGQWLVQNAKGRVRVLGGLEAQEPSEPFLGSIDRQPGESVGTPARAASASDDSKCVHVDAVESVVSESRAVREAMAQHIGQNTVCADADSLLARGTAAYNELELLLKMKQDEKEELEDEYLKSSAADQQVIDEITDSVAQVAKLTSEMAMWQSAVPAPPENRPPRRCNGVSCCGVKAPFHRHRLV